uniref:Uncharacterized protein n=1 Tax=Peronospora matthiolae TaxID=2874970 RepID=A0AAV1V938_9STRA
MRGAGSVLRMLQSNSEVKTRPKCRFTEKIGGQTDADAKSVTIIDATSEVLVVATWTEQIVDSLVFYDGSRRFQGSARLASDLLPRVCGRDVPPSYVV